MPVLNEQEVRAFLENGPPPYTSQIRTEVTYYRQGADTYYCRVTTQDNGVFIIHYHPKKLGDNWLHATDSLHTYSVNIPIGNWFFNLLDNRLLNWHISW